MQEAYEYPLQNNEIIMFQARQIAELQKQLSFRQSTNDILFIDYLKNYAKQKNSIGENTARTYNSQLERHILPYFSKYSYMLNEITHSIIEKYYQYELQQGMSPNSVIRYHSFLFSAFKYAAKHDLIEKNPMDKVSRPKEVPYIANWLDAEQIQLLLTTASKHWLFTPIFIAVTLGLRHSEIIALRWSNINLKKGIVSIKEKTLRVDGQDKVVKKLKSQSSYRTLVLPDVLLHFLCELKRAQDKLKKSLPKELHQNFRYVCLDMKRNKGARLKLEPVSKGFARLIGKISDIENIRFHDLRHTCATFLLHNGCTMRQVQDWLGHSNYATTAKFYTHVDITDKERSAAAINSVLLNFSCDLGDEKNLVPAVA